MSKFHESSNGLSDPIKCYGKGVVGYVERKDVKSKTRMD